MYVVTERSGKVIVKSSDEHIILRGVVEDKNTSEMSHDTSFTVGSTLLGVERVPILNIKSLTFTFPEILKYIHLNTSSKES